MRDPETAAETDGGPPRPHSLPEQVLVQAVADTDSAISVADAQAPDLPLVYVNGAFEDLSGYRAADILGRNCRVVQSPLADPAARAEIAASLRGHRPAQVRILNQRPDGEHWWNDLRLSYVRDSTGTVSHVLGLQHDVTEQVHREQHLLSLAYRDPLTGLPNRHQLDGHLTSALARADRAGEAVAVLFLDLDGFKHVNDGHGHAVGDLLLRSFAHRLRGAVRRTDLIVRHGGDEFVVLLADLDRVQARHDAAVTARQIHDSLARPFDLPSGAARVQVSIGTALYPEDATGPHGLVELADRRMYRSKSGPAGGGSGR